MAGTAALGAILIPMMTSKGYKVEKATAPVGSTGIIGTVSPPSIPMILFGVIGGVSVTGMFMSGIVMAFLFPAGCVMDMTPAILIFGPVLLRVVDHPGVRK